MIPTDMLQGSVGTLGTILATWLIWPILGGYIGYRKGDLRRGVINGLFWGPIGLALALLLERKYVCPTCGHKTLKQPHAGEARPTSAFNIPVPPPEELPRPAIAADRCAPKPMSKEEREKIVMAACAGYDAKEEARLRSWLNSD